MLTQLVLVLGPCWTSWGQRIAFTWGLNLGPRCTCMLRTCFELMLGIRGLWWANIGPVRAYVKSFWTTRGQSGAHVGSYGAYVEFMLSQKQESVLVSTFHWSTFPLLFSFHFSTFRFFESDPHFLTFRLFEIEYMIIKLFDFSKTFQLFEIRYIIIQLVDFSKFQICATNFSTFQNEFPTVSRSHGAIHFANPGRVDPPKYPKRTSVQPVLSGASTYDLHSDDCRQIYHLFKWQLNRL